MGFFEPTRPSPKPISKDFKPIKSKRPEDLKKSFSQYRDPTTGFQGSYNMGLHEKEMYKREIIKNYGYDFSPEEVKKEIGKLKQLESSMRYGPVKDSRAADEFKNKRQMLEKLDK